MKHIETIHLLYICIYLYIYTVYIWHMYLLLCEYWINFIEPNSNNIIHHSLYIVKEQSHIKQLRIYAYTYKIPAPMCLTKNDIFITRASECLVFTHFYILYCTFIYCTQYTCIYRKYYLTQFIYAILCKPCELLVRYTLAPQHSAQNIWKYIWGNVYLMRSLCFIWVYT